MVRYSKLCWIEIGYLSMEYLLEVHGSIHIKEVKPNDGSLCMDLILNSYSAESTFNQDGNNSFTMLMALLLLRHALYVSNPDSNDGDDDGDIPSFFSLFLLRAAGFLLPCYIMAWAISMLQRPRQRQAAALAASEVAYVIQAGQNRGLHFTVSPGPAVTAHHREPLQ